MVLRATSKSAEASLPSGSYIFAPKGGTEAPGRSSALETLTASRK